MRGIAELVRTILLAGIVFVGARTVVLPFQVEGASMTPNLHDRERVLVNRTVYFHFDLYGVINVLPGVELDGSREVFPFHPPERGDVVVLNPPMPARPTLHQARDRACPANRSGSHTAPSTSTASGWTSPTSTG